MALTKKQEQKIKEGVLKESEELELAGWCYEQDGLYQKGKLSKEKIKKLKDINFPFGTYCKMKHFKFKGRSDFTVAVGIAKEWSNGRHYCVNAKDKVLSIEV